MSVGDSTPQPIGLFPVLRASSVEVNSLTGSPDPAAERNCASLLRARKTVLPRSFTQKIQCERRYRFLDERFVIHDEPLYNEHEKSINKPRFLLRPLYAYVFILLHNTCFFIHIMIK